MSPVELFLRGIFNRPNRRYNRLMVERVIFMYETTCNRRYVGTKETVAYILDDIAQSFNIDSYRNFYITNILKIGLGFQKTTVFIMGIWDIYKELCVP